MVISEHEKYITELERENRILKKKLERSEENRASIEELLETHTNALKVRNAELEESRELIKKSEERYRELAHYDNLTGLPNRAFFHEKLVESLNDAKLSKTCVALLFIDLDFFKPINDSLGHKAGDLVLCETAHRLLSCVRTNDTVSRLGGDEFAVILTDAKCSTIENITQRITEVISKPFCIEGEHCRLGISIGISLYPDDDTDHEKLLQKADFAMYTAKKRRNNRYIFYRDIYE